MRPEDVAGELNGLAVRAARTASPVAMAMGHAYQRRLQTGTLVEFAHAEDTKTPSPPHAPPAFATGKLLGSITTVNGPGGLMSGTSFVSPHTVYAVIQEYGGEVVGKRSPRKLLRFPLDGKIYYKHRVYVPERPYMRPTTREMIRDGSLTRTAMTRFRMMLWGA